MWKDLSSLEAIENRKLINLITYHFKLLKNKPTAQTKLKGKLENTSLANMTNKILLCLIFKIIIKIYGKNPNIRKQRI